MAFDPEIADAAWIGEWITGRALARGLPSPFPDRGAWRAEIGSESELRRWIFPALTPELRALAEEIADPRLKLRALASPEAMAAHLPHTWRVEAPSFSMVAVGGSDEKQPVPEGYRLEVRAEANAVHTFIFSSQGELAAWGHAGMACEAFVYDRIVTQEVHRRKGLATAVMTALACAQPQPEAPRILVATQAGRHLYESLGWRVVSPYASATWIGDSPVQK